MYMKECSLYVCVLCHLNVVKIRLDPVLSKCQRLLGLIVVSLKYITGLKDKMSLQNWREKI